MPTERYSPAQAAAIVGVSASTIRAWCKEFTDYLSAGATPAPGGERVLTAQDVAVLQQVRELRTQGADVAAILQALADTPSDRLQPYVDGTVNTPNNEPASPTEALQANTTALVVSSLITEQLSTLQARIDTIEQKQVGTVNSFLFGFIAGLLLALFAMGLLLLGARLGG
jgi:DNA-binding transcriptional MerR regulator